MRTIYPLVLALVILVPTLPIHVHASPTVFYTAGVKPGDSWTYGAFACVGSGCPTVSITSVNARVESVTGTTVVASFSISYSNGIVVRQHLQTDVQTGIGNGTLLIIAAGLVAGNPVNTQPFSPKINATLTKTYAGASRDVNMVEFSNPFSGIFTILWDQKTGILVEALIGMPRTSFSPGLAEHVVLKSTNIWSPEHAPHFSLTSSDFLLSGTVGMTAKTTLTGISAGFSKTIVLTATSFPLGPSVGLAPSSLALVKDSSVTSILTVTMAGRPGFYLITVVAAGTTASRADVTFLLLNVIDKPPMVSFSTSATIVPTGTPVTLTISASDPDGTVSALKVSWGDGTVDSLSGTVTTDIHSYALAGSYSVYVNATDNSGLTTKSSVVTITICDFCGSDPTVSFSESATTVPTGTSITLTISDSDPDGTVSSLKVVWGDGTVDTLSPTATTDSHSYSSAGSYLVYVNATDNSGLTTKSPLSLKTVT